MKGKVEILEKALCYHCGETCIEEEIRYDEKSFCCNGCKLVYELLSENQLCTYYSLGDQPGNTQRTAGLGDRYAYLDEEKIRQKLIRYSDQENDYLKLHVPGMHCSSCIWLLEHLNRLDKGIVRSTVDFVHKEITIVLRRNKTTLRNVVEVLVRIGYTPELSLEQYNRKVDKKERNTRIYKIGLAGFAFGNIMLMSFPEYFSNGVYHGEDFRNIFGVLNLILAIPVFFYSASEFLENALLCFRQRVINIDFPIAVGIVAMFLTSTYEILSGTGAGYFDSMTGLVFFMLIGRNFQNKTFDWLSFDRDYKSYFPIAIQRLSGIQKTPVPVPVQELKVNDLILIRNQEIIPTDALLISDQALIDYSFVTGESRPIECVKGERIFAGGRMLGSGVELVVQNEVSQSYLTQLWNQSSGKKEFKSGFQLMVENISRWFVAGTLLIATGAFIYWHLQNDLPRGIHAFTSVLVIACACALALSAPFTYGNMLRILGRKGIYLKNAGVLEKLSDIDTVVFDKTGTLTESSKSSMKYEGIPLDAHEYEAVGNVAFHSSHPLCRYIGKECSSTRTLVSNLEETTGAGVSGKADGKYIQLGSARYIGFSSESKRPEGSEIHLKINGEYRGVFLFRQFFRPSAARVISDLKKQGKKIAVVSGDHDYEHKDLAEVTGQTYHLFFEQKPHQKKDYIDSLGNSGHKVMMMGDGLNDAGALMNSHVGISIAEDVNNFTPGSDGIILSSEFENTPALLRYARSGKKIIIISFIISLAYNFAGLWFAVQGSLSPVIAAILMPISTTSLVLYTVVASTIKARQLKLK